MTAARLMIGAICAGLSAAVFAQATPVPAMGTTAPTTSQAATAQGAVVQQDKETSGKSSQDQATPGQRRSTTPGYVPPLNIKIQDAGIAVPKCMVESREGEACK